MKSTGENSRPVDREIIQISLIRNEKLIRGYESLEIHLNVFVAVLLPKACKRNVRIKVFLTVNLSNVENCNVSLA